MTKLAEDLFKYFKDTGKKTYERDDCFNVTGVTRTNVDGILDDLVRHEKIIIDRSSIPPKIDIID